MTDAEREEYIRYLNDQYDLLIFKIAYAIIKDEDLVQDIKQQVLIKLTPKAELLAPLHHKQVTAYVGTTTRNVAITEYNKQASYENNKEQVKEKFSKLMTMDHVEFKAFEGKYGFGEEMWELLMKLTPLEREIMIYKYYYDYNAEEIGRIIGTNNEMVKKRLQRTRKKLEKMIKEKGVDFK